MKQRFTADPLRSQVDNLLESGDGIVSVVGGVPKEPKQLLDLLAESAVDNRDALELGTAATEDATAFATAAQGGKADTALQSLSGALLTGDISSWAKAATKPTYTYSEVGADAAGAAAAVTLGTLGAARAIETKTGDFTAVVGGCYIVETATIVSITDPAGTTQGQSYEVWIGSGTIRFGGAGTVFAASRLSIRRRYTGSAWATLSPTVTDLLTANGGLTTAGTVTFAAGTTFGAMGTGVAALFRAALLSGTVGDALFLAATQAAAQSALGVMARSKSRAVLIEHEFCGASTFSLAPFVTTAISSGTLANGLGITLNHPGICIIKDSTTANGGYVFRLDSVSGASLLLGGGERFILVFQINSNRSTQTVRVGFHNAVTITAPTNGVYIELIGNGSTGAVATGKATNAGGTGSTGSTFTCLTDTWYSLKIELNSNASGATFTIYNEAGASVWSDTVGSTYIPTAAGRFTDVGIIATESTTDAAANMISIDYVLCDINRDLVR